MTTGDPTPVFETEGVHAARFEEQYAIKAQQETSAPLYKLRTTLIQITSALAGVSLAADGEVVRQIGALVCEARALITQLEEDEDEMNECKSRGAQR